MSVDNKERLMKLKQRKHQLEQEYEKKLEIEKATRSKLMELESEFEYAKNNRLLHAMNPAKIKKFLRTVASFLLGRRNRKQLYSKTYKRKQASNDIKPYKYALYNEGFERAIQDMLAIYEQTANRYVKRAIAWEIGLWHANKQTVEGAQQALSYLMEARKGENDFDLLRRIAIVEAECLKLAQRPQAGKEIIHNRLQREKHPDLFLALANLEASNESRKKWINNMLEKYDLKPIAFCSEKTDATYDDLCTKASYQKMDGPKISVILPAYNSEKGIRIAIESILSQTWGNIELLIVDDCSTDNTLDVIQSYANKDSRIVVLKTPQNSGPYAARNIALQKATGEFVTVNDADDWSHSEKLEIQANHLLKNPAIIANTSEQARLTEDLQFYRRGTPGTYIFSNMSSLMFRRVPALERIGFWDNVRFAADGEFKRRLVHEFGKAAVADLSTGPLSFPRQTATSLTGSSAFGYNGFFMGARREYVESFSFYHQKAKSLYYPAAQQERLFPVPYPMLPNRKKTERRIDIVMAADFYQLEDDYVQLLIKEIGKNKQMGLKTGLMQMASYDVKKKKKFNATIRQLLDGQDVQMIVYGEKIRCNLLIVRSPRILNERQMYIPNVTTLGALVIIDELPKMSYNSNKEPTYKIRQSLYRLMASFDKRGRWYPLNEKVRSELHQHHQRELKSIQLAYEDWVNEEELPEEKYALRIKDWLVQ